MTITDWFKHAQQELTDNNIETPRLDCLVLLEDALGRDRSWVLAHGDEDLSVDRQERLDSWLARRVKHEPLAYIRGHAAFYGRDFVVGRDVLVPRPETEDMIDLLKSLNLPPASIIADVGTGSGALAVTAALEVPHSVVHGTDIDDKCLEVAGRNARRNEARVNFLQGNLLQPLKQADMVPDVLLCNLPYVPENYAVNPATGFEPLHALYSGTDGLDHYRRLVQQLDQVESQYVFTETLDSQKKPLELLFAQGKYHLQQERGLIQLFKASS